MTSKLPRIVVRLGQIYTDKLNVIAYRNIRPSLNNQIAAILIRFVENYEKAHGEIDEAAIKAVPEEWKKGKRY